MQFMQLRQLSQIKHLRGKHDQRDHGRRGIGQGSGGVSQAFSKAESQFSASELEQARIDNDYMADMELTRIKQSTNSPPDQLRAIRDYMRVQERAIALVKKRRADIDKKIKKGIPLSDSEKSKLKALNSVVLAAATAFEKSRQEHNNLLASIRSEKAKSTSRGQYRQPRPKSSLTTYPARKTADDLAKGTISSASTLIGQDGLPSMTRIERGTNNIQTINDATRFLDDGGDISGVPDDFLLEAMRGSSRFTQENAGWAGVNGAPTIFTDTRTGRRYLSKYEQTSYAPNEDIAEVLGNNIAGRLGFPVGGVRFAGPLLRATPQSQTPRKGQPSASLRDHRPVIIEHVGNYIDGPTVVPKSVGSTFTSTTDGVNATLLDFIMLNPDRHERNYFFTGNLRVMNGKYIRQFIPIDSSLGFQNTTFQIPDSMASNSGLYDFLTQGSVPFTLLFGVDYQKAKEQGSDDEFRQEVQRAFERAQQRLRESEDRLPFRDAAGDATYSAGTFDDDGFIVPRQQSNEDALRLIEFPNERIQYILGLDPAEFTDQLLQGLEDNYDRILMQAIADGDI